MCDHGTMKPSSARAAGLAVALVCACAPTGAGAGNARRDPAAEAGLLRLLFPEDRATERAARNQSIPAGMIAISPSSYAGVIATYRANVISRMVMSTVVEYQTIEEPGDGSAADLGLAVIHRGSVRWRSPLVAVRSRETAAGPNSTALSLRRNVPEALLWTLDHGKGMTSVRESVRVFSLWQWLDGRMVELLREEIPVRSGPGADDVSMRPGAQDKTGWRLLEIAAVGAPEPGGNMTAGTRIVTRSFGFLNGHYALVGTRETTTSHKLRLLRKIAPFDPAGWPDPTLLPSIATLSTGSAVVRGFVNWRGPAGFSARILGGSADGSLVLLYRVTDSSSLYMTAEPHFGPNTTQHDLRRTDHVEASFWERGGRAPVQLAISPGNMSNVQPFFSQWEPDVVANVPGVRVRAWRTRAGYDLLVVFAPEFFEGRVRLADAFVCFAVVNVQDYDKPARDCTLSTAEKYRWNDIMTFNPIIP